jgi:hypothetical protein
MERRTQILALPRAWCPKGATVFHPPPQPALQRRIRTKGSYKGGPQGRMRGAEGHNCLAPNTRKDPLIASLRPARLPAGEKREIVARPRINNGPQHSPPPRMRTRSPPLRGRCRQSRQRGVPPQTPSPPLYPPLTLRAISPSRGEINPPPTPPKMHHRQTTPHRLLLKYRPAARGPNPCACPPSP